MGRGLFRERPVGGRLHFVRPRGVDPKLNDFQQAAFLREGDIGPLAVYNACAAVHPLRAPGPHHVVVAAAVAVADGPGIDGRHRGEPAVGVRADADFELVLASWQNVLPMVQQQKRADAIQFRSGQRLLNPVGAHQHAAGRNSGQGSGHA